MSDSPAVIVYDVSGNAVGVSGSMLLPTGALGHLAAGVDQAGKVQYLPILSGSLQVTGSVLATVPSAPGASLDMSGTLSASFTYGPINLLSALCFAFQATLNAFPNDAATGSVYVQVSTDPFGGSPVYWNSLSGSTAGQDDTFSLLSGSNASWYVNGAAQAAWQARVQYVHVSGTGSVHLSSLAKGG